MTYLEELKFERGNNGEFTVSPSIDRQLNIGYWERNKYMENYCSCSVCGRTAFQDKLNGGLYEYCPHCGSRMMV